MFPELQCHVTKLLPYLVTGMFKGRTLSGYRTCLVLCPTPDWTSVTGQRQLPVLTPATWPWIAPTAVSGREGGGRREESYCSK